MIPSTTELLLTLVTNGFGGRPPAAPMRWIGDAMALLQLEAHQVDWDALLERARRPGLILSLRDGLGFLARELGAPVPAEVLAELDRRTVSRRERLAHWAALNDPRIGVTLAVELELHRTRRLHPAAGAPRDLLGHLAQVTGAATGSRRQLLAEQGGRLATRLRTRSQLIRSGLVAGQPGLSEPSWMRFGPAEDPQVPTYSGFSGGPKIAARAAQAWLPAAITRKLIVSS